MPSFWPNLILLWYHILYNTHFIDKLAIQLSIICTRTPHGPIPKPTGFPVMKKTMKNRDFQSQNFLF